MSTWRKRFSRKTRRLSENNESLLNNTVKYRKKLHTAITQINRTKKSVQRNLDHSDSEIHVARLINDIGQLSECKPLQEIGSLIDSLAMRYQLSSRIFNEYSMNSLEQTLEKLNNNLTSDFDQSKSVFDEAVTNHCSDHTQKQLFNKVQIEWSKHQKLAMKELKYSLSSYCNIGLYNLKIQTAILEKLQNCVHQLPPDENDPNIGLPNFPANSQQARKEIDTMLRIMLDSAPNDPASLPNPKRPRFLTNQITLSNSLYSTEITEAAARSHRQQIPQYPPPSAPTNESIILTPSTPSNDQLQNNDDYLPSYTDLFVVPSSCRGARLQRRSPRFTNQ